MVLAQWYDGCSSGDAVTSTRSRAQKSVSNCRAEGGCGPLHSGHLSLHAHPVIWLSLHGTSPPPNTSVTWSWSRAPFPTPQPAGVRDRSAKRALKGVRGRAALRLLGSGMAGS